MLQEKEVTFSKIQNKTQNHPIASGWLKEKMMVKHTRVKRPKTQCALPGLLFLFICLFSFSLANFALSHAVAANLSAPAASQCLANAQTALAHLQADAENARAEDDKLESQTKLPATAATGNAESLTKAELMSRRVLLGGQSIGILLQTEGASVVGFAPVIGEDGEPCFPAKESGLKIGDFITEINHQTITTDEEIGRLVNENGQGGKTVTVSVNREGQPIEIEVDPSFCKDTNTWRVGLYVRDNTAGVGTLTFYEPQSKTYGALGHKVADLDDKIVDGQQKGSILSASIQDIKQGRKGEPGEKVGVFTDGGIAGSITQNSEYGIFGKISSNLDNSLYPQTVPIATADQVKEGPATILTVVSGEELQEFQVEIEKVMPQHKASGKGMVIKVTDPELLKLSGGIVQGMSGSPILQDGKWVGAVTHVFVNDPTSGFGCFAEWMAEEATKDK